MHVQPAGCRRPAARAGPAVHPQCRRRRRRQRHRASSAQSRLDSPEPCTDMHSRPPASTAQPANPAAATPRVQCAGIQRRKCLGAGAWLLGAAGIDGTGTGTSSGGDGAGDHAGVNSLRQLVCGTVLRMDSSTRGEARRGGGITAGTQAGTQACRKALLPAARRGPIPGWRLEPGVQRAGCSLVVELTGPAQCRRVCLSPPETCTSSGD